MSGLSCFLAENAEKRTNKKVVVSQRFKDETGKPVEWEIRSISAEEDNRLRIACTKRVNNSDKRSGRQEFDSNKYLELLTAESVVFPDLRNAELQNSYHVMEPTALLSAMLYADEYANLANAVVSAANNEDLNSLIEEAKN